LSISTEAALAAVLNVANTYKVKWAVFPAQLRVGLDISRALLRAGTNSGSILLYPNNPDSWVLLVADPGLAAQVVLASPQSDTTT
jgi:hypothetical protein